MEGDVIAETQGEGDFKARCVSKLKMTWQWASCLRGIESQVLVNKKLIKTLMFLPSMS